MRGSRWLRLVIPALIAFGTTGAIAATATGAVARPWAARSCSESRTDPSMVSTSPIELEELGRQPWYRLDPRLDRSGTLEGQRLSFGLDGERDGWVVDLPAESFAAGPFGQAVLVGSDDGTSSRLLLLLPAERCFREVAIETDVVRRATVDPGGERIYEFRVDRASREDMGVWVRRADGRDDPFRVLPAIPPDERFGRTYSTEFSWSLDGTRLAVQSCGELACRTRLLDPENGTVATVDRPDLGTMIGIDGTTLVSYAACWGLPCPIVATDVAAGGATPIADAGAAAVLVVTPEGSRLVHEAYEDSGLVLRAATLDGAATQDLGGLDADLRLLQPARFASSATAVPQGWVALAPQGRLPAVDPAAHVRFRQASSGRTVLIQEITR